MHVLLRSQDEVPSSRVEFIFPEESVSLWPQEGILARSLEPRALLRTPGEGGVPSGSWLPRGGLYERL